PLAGEGTPRERIAAMTRELDSFYQGGKQACLLNSLSSPIREDSPFKATIRQMFDAFIKASASVIAETGCPVSVAQERAERALVSIQGSLVLARGLGSTAPFHRASAALPEESLAGIGDNS
ncbi:hypothetical protein OY671_008724, partial [Metschnikowia pulcherrima]